MDYSKYILIFFILLLIYIFFRVREQYTSEEKRIKSIVDGKTYTIRNGQGKSEEFLQESADALGTINLRIQTLIKFLDSKYKNNNEYNHIIKKLKENYSPYMISEAAIDNRYTSYTIDKQDMYLCLRTRDSHEKIYDINTLMYVTLHELAHLCNYSKSGVPIEGHGPEFRKIFALLVREAIQLNLYQYRDYSRNPQEYCNIMITSQIV